MRNPIRLMIAGAAKRAVGNPRLSRHLADFVQPNSWNHFGDSEVWAADNGCFGNFDRAKFIRMLDACAAAPVKPKFIAVPDVVCDHKGSVERFLEWAPEFHKRGLPRAFVLQNGIEDLPPQQAIPWGSIDALFIGGDDAFKMGPWVKEACRIARACRPWRQIWIHMGRVNSVKRMRIAQSFGCDSCDGSGMVRFPIVLERMVRELDAQEDDLFAMVA